ncbi:MAG: hypothetical protein IJE08_04330 [Clostridia bacterium]|nr:hypothetical protein [Clostridia bacterium]
MSWKICYRGTTDTANFGLECVQAAAQEYLHYQPVVSDSISLSFEDDLILLACRNGNNCQNKELDSIAGQTIPSGEGYLVAFKEHPYCPGRKMVLVVSETELGLMYGCVDLAEKYLPRAAQAHQHNPEYYYFKNPFEEGFEEAAYVSVPSLKERGLWTWGHVIYDYRAYFDNMARCKLNTITIWNDFAPVNEKEVYEYAHSRGIRVIWGLSLNWDEKEDISSEESMNKWAEIALKRCKKLYDKGIVDGVYVQTFTETRDEKINGLLIAEYAVKWINTIYGRIAEEIPQIDFRWGLHAMSVMNTPEIIAKTNPNVKIIWEDAGQFPYNYVPELDVPGFGNAMESTKVLASLRDGIGAGATLKGLCCLDWKTFRHMEGPVQIGCASRAWMEGLLPEKKKIWKYVQSHWLVNAEACREVIAEYAHATRGEAALCGLVEDGLFEMKIWFPVALFAEMMWNCTAPVGQLLTETAQRANVEFA